MKLPLGCRVRVFPEREEILLAAFALIVSPDNTNALANVLVALIVVTSGRRRKAGR